MVLKLNNFRGVFECDGGDDVGGYFLLGEAEDDVGFSSSGISDEDDCMI